MYDIIDKTIVDLSFLLSTILYFVIGYVVYKVAYRNGCDDTLMHVQAGVDPELYISYTTSDNRTSFRRIVNPQIVRFLYNEHDNSIMLNIQPYDEKRTSRILNASELGTGVIFKFSHRGLNRCVPIYYDGLDYTVCDDSGHPTYLFKRLNNELDDIPIERAFHSYRRRIGGRHAA